MSEKEGGLGRNGWWGCDGKELYNERKEHWEKGMKKGDREECIKEERGTKSLFFGNLASSGVFV